MGTTCSTIRVQSGDSCASLAARCGINSTDFYDYNPQANLCSTLTPGQYICCSSGSLPDLAPKTNANGTCATYLVQPGDTCNQLAVDYPPLTVNEIEQYNNATWGWLGCSDLQAHQYMCLSSGTPPFPAPVAGTACGPQVPNTVEPANGTNWASLNPCPLNACCDIWGQCGTFPEFCTVTNSTTGAPGTAAPGSNGCISNCGVALENDSTPPAEFASIGYFEGFNSQRPCLNMAAKSIDTSRYTHIHYAFGNITADFGVNDGGYTDQFTEFTQLNGVKRILSFGGWDFSTNPATYMIFREGVSVANRNLLAQNIVQFITTNGLDGVDFDWEYPGEPDIVGIPADSPDDGANYLAFLTGLRTILPANKTISIAAPASYWYLKGFPIQEIAGVVDYIIYMTYDLQGIWSLGNSNAQDGCPAGNCLRSDINITETTYALSMLTKAGVSSNKIMVGVTSYGRSFTMSTPGCTTSNCTYTGPGLEGECTQTAGYMAQAEINQIILDNPTAQTLKDSSTDTDILVYNNTQWVGYMSNDSRTDRTALYKYLNFGGTSEWAIDLEAFVPSVVNASSTTSTIPAASTILTTSTILTASTILTTSTTPTAATLLTESTTATQLS